MYTCITQCSDVVFGTLNTFNNLIEFLLAYFKKLEKHGTFIIKW